LAERVDGELGDLLSELVTITEVTALQSRIAGLIRKPFFPVPPEHRSPIPWPPL